MNAIKSFIDNTLGRVIFNVILNLSNSNININLRIKIKKQNKIGY